MIFTVRLCLLLSALSYNIIHAPPPPLPPRPPMPPGRQYLIESDLPYPGWAGGGDNPSGAIPGAYYGTGNNPNYGNVGPNSNDAQNGIGVVNYNNPNLMWNQQQQQQPFGMQQQQQQQQPQQYQLNNNNNNGWQSPNGGSNNNNNGLQRPNGGNNYYNSPSNRYPPGSQGWYATGGNYWYDNGGSTKPYSWSIILIILAVPFVCI